MHHGKRGLLQTMGEKRVNKSIYKEIWYSGLHEEIKSNVNRWCKQGKQM